jgi:CubicO group peptidase (beta-lactamase class C family)
VTVGGAFNSVIAEMSLRCVDGFRNGGDRQAFARSDEGQPGSAMEGWSYRDQWWVTHNDHGAFTALGIYGQWCYVDPVARMVIAKHSSFTVARGRPLDNDTIYAFDAMGKALARQD